MIGYFYVAFDKNSSYSCFNENTREGFNLDTEFQIGKTYMFKTNYCGFIVFDGYTTYPDKKEYKVEIDSSDCIGVGVFKKIKILQ